MQKLAEIYLEPWWRFNIETDEIDKFFAQNHLDAALESPIDADWAGLVPTLGRISATYAKAGNSERALEVAHSIESDLGQALALKGVAETLAKQAEVSRALEVAGSIDDPELRVRAMVAIGRTIVGGTLIGEDLAGAARAVLSEAFSVAQSSLGEALSDFDSASLQEVSQSEVDLIFVTIVDQSLALASVHAALLEVVPDPESQEGATKKQLFEVGLSITLSAAVEIASLIEEPVLSSLSLWKTAREYIEAGLEDSAVEVLQLSWDATSLAESSVFRYVHQGQIAATYAMMGDNADAEERAYAIQDPFHRASALVRVARVYADTDRQELALPLLEDATNLTALISDSSLRVFNMARIARALAEAGDFQEALLIAGAIDEPDERAEAVVSIGVVATRSGLEEIEIAALALELQGLVP